MQVTGLPPPFDPNAFFVKDYELKATYLTNHLTRLWGRFSMFVTLESALAALMVAQGKLSHVAPRVAIVSAVLSALWFALGRHDRHLIRIYRQQIRDAVGALPLANGYCGVSEVAATNAQVKAQVGTWGILFEGRTANEVPLFPVLVPAVTFVLWVVLAITL
ncbi:MAG: RipA family octameric membrane protein [Solirubrobacteraceae bacterium]